jgi:2-oxoisovalerate dehydrogenase E2 component (dihydrolipoyl transacylase)
MGIHVIKLPDVGEGVAEAEFVAVHVKPGDAVNPDQTLADVMTDKATVEIPAPMAGKIVWIGPEIGETVAVGSAIIKLEVDGKGNEKPGEEAVSVKTPEAKATKEKPTEKPKTEAAPKVEAKSVASPASAANGAAARPHFREAGEKPLAAPAVRSRARSQGIDLQLVHGSGPAGRITHEDLDHYIANGPVAGASGGNVLAPNSNVEEIKVIGLRRKIAAKMQDAKRRIPHFAYVEECDVTALEDLRQHMNKNRTEGQPKLTVLPFIMRALVLAIKDYPQMNVRYDDDENIVYRFGGVHMGIATQTANGLIVPVVRHAEANDLWANANEVKRLADAARDGSAKREELSGSTITVTSLGPLGGIVTTPVINHPEVAILGINKIVTRPMYNDQGQVVPRKMMNLSSSFDHRVVDGWDAAEFIQKIRAYLEYPATLFI